MATEELSREEMRERMKSAPPKRKRRIYLRISGYGTQRLLLIAVTGSALFGAVLGDIWLWRLLYG